MARQTWIGWLLLGLALGGAGGVPEGVRDTQKAGDRPPTPEESLARITVPDGFRVTLFAGEPDVHQPVAIAFDHRGRLWVVECYSYPDWEKFEGKDRVLIFEDADNDGRFDKRTVFLDNGKNLTGIELGFGGVWLCSAPNLLFVPDGDGDDVPDGEPIVELDGWDYKKSQHNVVNGLAWGPDGWLYGCHGILAESRVGRPGTPDEQRTRINCGVWRFHPVRKEFEVFAHGTTNPWGLDFDDYGEMFAANCVIEHLWHLVPGGRYKRMFGQDYNPYTYQLMGPASDHLHWQGDDWNAPESWVGEKARLGGGHAHCGTMVYLGDNWPEEYRNNVFTHNLHGQRINRDLLVRKGSGYVATHGPDFLFANSPWFRGVAIAYGPDGGVFITDWSDLGECHDEDGVHRASGRIYKIVYGEVAKPQAADLGKLSDEELVKLHLHRNEWYVRHARRVLQERAARGTDIAAVGEALGEQLRFSFGSTDGGASRRLRMAWTLHAIGQLGADQLLELMSDRDERVRAWAVRLEAEDHTASQAAMERLAEMAWTDPSPVVRLALASALQRLPNNWAIAAALTAHAEDKDDPNIPPMVWYGIEGRTSSGPSRPGSLLRVSKVPSLLRVSKIPLLRASIARRLMDQTAPNALGALLRLLAETEDSSAQSDLLRGMTVAIRGRRAETPGGWAPLYDRLSRSSDDEVRRLARLLALALGDQRAKIELRKALRESGTNIDAKREALQALVEQRDPEIVPTLQRLVGDPELGRAAIRGLAAYNDPDTPAAILRLYADLSAEAKADAVATLASRSGYAAALLDAVERGAVPRQDISVVTARQINQVGDAALRERLAAVWGVVQTSASDKQAMIARYEASLTPDVLAYADLSAGRATFAKVCANCHKLFGEGADVGPDLTGSQRANLQYVLLNTIDPSAIVGRDHQLTTIATADGRSLQGIIKAENDAAVTLRTATEELLVPKDQIATRATLPISMMPEGLLLGLSEQDVRDLVAYLASPGQVEVKE